jgi:DNA-nicking Smr family endonuclease
VTDDDDLFRKAVSGAKPLRAEERVTGAARKPPPKARFARADEKAALRESLEAEIDDLHSHSGESLVQAEIDLHGMTVTEAKPRLADFIESCARDGKLCVRIVHGKGLGSGQRGPVLKQKVNRWLRQWDAVVAFVSTRQVDGGTGALYVLLQSD